MSNLPSGPSTDSAESVKLFFDKFFTGQVSYPSEQIDAVIGFFLKRGFDPESARSTSIVILNQARTDDVSVFALLDTMKTLTDVQLSQVIAQVLNTYREKTSLLGFRVAPVVDEFETRNILI